MHKDTFEIINRIAEEHSKKIFGYLTQEDLKGEIWSICLERLKDYDQSRGELEHFLRVSVKNRLVNRFKDITKSVRSPCPRCPYFDKGNDPDCARFGHEKNLCSKWKNYQLSIASRNSLLNASEEQYERSVLNSTLNRMVGMELSTIVIDNIDISFKHDLVEFMSSGKISKQRIKKLKKEIVKILSSFNYDSDLEVSKPVQITINKKHAKKKKKK
jgi:hypothetical protein